MKKQMLQLIMEQEKALSPNDALSDMLRDVLGDMNAEDDLTDEELELAIGAAKKEDKPLPDWHQ